MKTPYFVHNVLKIKIILKKKYNRSVFFRQFLSRLKIRDLFLFIKKKKIIDQLAPIERPDIR